MTNRLTTRLASDCHSNATPRSGTTTDTAPPQVTQGAPTHQGYTQPPTHRGPLHPGEPFSVLPRHHGLTHDVESGWYWSWEKRSVSRIVGCAVECAEPHAERPEGVGLQTKPRRQTHERDYHFVHRTGRSQRFHCHCGSASGAAGTAICRDRGAGAGLALQGIATCC